MVEKSKIPFSEIESIPQLVKDFLASELSDFKENVFNTENIKKAILRKESSFSPSRREILVEAFHRQYNGFELSSLQQENIDHLKSQKTFTVVTGHQLNLFSGPAFFVYKILQTIKTAQFISEQEADFKVIPIFWMASEDHDFDEINHFRTLDHYYEIKGNQGGAVGRIKIEDQFFISEFEKEFKDSVYGTELIRWIKNAYAEGNTLAQATKTLVQYLFADFGLLCLDGDDAALKQAMIPTFKDELENQSLFKYSKSKVGFLTERYGKVQVNPRDINLFYLSETRNRIEENKGQYYIVDQPKQFTNDEMIAELNQIPERFSPNALMRPVYQETILPNIAYIGGNAEIMYWLELKDYFEYLQLPFPMLIPRNSMLFLEKKVFRKIEKMDLNIQDFFKNFASLVHSELLKNTDIDDIISEKRKEVLTIFETLKNESAKTDITFKNLVEAEETRQLKSFDRMQKRLLRAEKIKQSEKIERLENLFMTIHPGKTWQERSLNFSVFYANAGRDWLHCCYDKMDVEKSTLIIMEI